MRLFVFIGSPSGVRTRVTGVRGRRPRPLDDGTVGQFLSGFNTANTYLMSNYKFASRYFCNSMGILGIFYALSFLSHPWPQ